MRRRNGTASPLVQLQKLHNIIFLSCKFCIRVDETLAAGSYCVETGPAQCGFAGGFESVGIGAVFEPQWHRVSIARRRKGFGTSAARISQEGSIEPEHCAQRQSVI